MITLGGQAGKAQEALKSRKQQLDSQESEAMGEAPKQTKTKDAPAVERPPMSKKWYE